MNNNAVMAYIAVGILMIAFVAYFMVFNHGGAQQKGKTTTETTTIKPGSNTVNSSKTTTAQQTSTVEYKGCISNAQEAAINNGGFESGNYEGWNVSGVGFGTAPTNIVSANADGAYYGSQWIGYNGTYFASTYHGGLSISPGNLTSDNFTVTEPYLNFKIASPYNNALYVEILENGKPFVKAYYNTRNVSGGAMSTFENASLPLTTLLCQNVSIKIVSGVVGTKSTEYEILSVGNFYMSKTPVETPDILVNETIV